MLPRKPKEGPAFYGREPNAETVTPERVKTPVAEALPFGDSAIVPFRGGATVRWRMAH